MHPVAVRLGNIILDILERHPLFTSYALPAKIVPPLFNAYRGGEHYGKHIDGAVRRVAGHSMRIRTDISATLFLSEPEGYEGGELVIEAAPDVSLSFKLAAGTLLLYPSGNAHYVAPVTQSERLASFFWVQSLIRSSERRAALLKLDQTVQHLTTRIPEDRSVVELTELYHNLLRSWADV